MNTKLTPPPVRTPMQSPNGLSQAWHVWFNEIKDFLGTGSFIPIVHALTHAPGASDTVFPSVAAGWLHSTAGGSLAWNTPTYLDVGAAPQIHYHSSLMASDGSPNPALSVDADGNLLAIGTLDMSGKEVNNINAIQFDITPTGITPSEGLLQWNNTDGTLNLGMSGGDVTMQIGQELFQKVRNVSGSTIYNGTPVYTSGRTGNRPNAYKARSDAESTSNVIGVTTQDILSPADGFVTTFGYVRGIKTNYTGSGDWGTTWVEGDSLYVSKTVAGQLTNVEPSAPHHSDRIGTVEIVHGTLGSILINLQHHVTMEELTDVNGTALTVTGQFPVWNNTAKYFDFDKNINDYAPALSLTTNYIPKAATATTLSNSILYDNGSAIGLNRVPETWSSSYNALQIGGTIAIMAAKAESAGDYLYLCNNMYFDGSWKRMINDEATYYSLGNGNFIWYSDAAGTADSAFTPTERMRLSASGNLGLGRVVESWDATYSALQIGGNTSIHSLKAESSLNFTNIVTNAYNDGSWKKITTGRSVIYQQYNGAHYWYTDSTSDADIAFTPTERMILSLDGNIGLGTSVPRHDISLNTVGGLDSYASEISIKSNCYYDGSDYRYLTDNGKVFSAAWHPASGFRLYGSDTASTGSSNVVSMSTLFQISHAGVVYVPYNIGIGCADPSVQLEITYDNTNAATCRLSNFGISYSPIIQLYHAQGTRTFPTATQTNDRLGAINFCGYDTDFSIGGSIYARATAEWGTSGDISDNPTILCFDVARDGSQALQTRLSIDNDNVFVDTADLIGYNNTVLLENSNISHSFTSIAPANAYGQLRTVSSNGGLYIDGFSDITDTGLTLSGYMNTGCLGPSCVEIKGFYSDGGTGVADVDSSHSLLAIINNATRCINVNGSGDTCIGTGTATARLSIDESCGIVTVDGYSGNAIKVIAGEALSKGNVVSWSTAADNRVLKSPADGDMPIGVAASDISNGASGWVIVSGYAWVLMKAGVSATHGDVLFMSNSAGRSDQSATVPAALTHWREIGHCVASSSASGALTLATLHFN